MHNDDDPTRDGRPGLWVPILLAAAVVVFVLLHLTGVVGPDAH